MRGFTKKQAVQSMVKASVRAFSEGFSARHLGEVKNPNGVINMKVHNVFIEALGKDIQYYASLVRSLDSSLGNMLEHLAIQIAELSFVVKTSVEGTLSAKQTDEIGRLLERYRREKPTPKAKDYQNLRKLGDSSTKNARHESDYYLIDKKTGTHHLIELKIGGDLDNKKARSEKEALLEQYAILSNTLPKSKKIELHFATAYNRYGEGKPWEQTRVLQYFSEEELLIGKNFWNFICKNTTGYKWVLDEYRSNASRINNALETIKQAYLGD